MGTNFYLRRVKPREVHDEYHIAKRSGGWKIHFQDSTDAEQSWWEGSGAPQPPSWHSVADLRNLLKSGDYQLSDEYGRVWEPGEDSIREFEELCAWNGGDAFTKPAVEKQPDEPYSNLPGVPYDHGAWPDEYRDPEGYAFGRRAFS